MTAANVASMVGSVLGCAAGVHFGMRVSFAVQAGREIGILVEPRGASDEGVANLGREVARWIEGQVMSPGRIKVTVIRELRVSEFAR